MHPASYSMAYQFLDSHCFFHSKKIMKAGPVNNLFFFGYVVIVTLLLLRCCCYVVTNWDNLDLDCTREFVRNCSANSVGDVDGIFLSCGWDSQWVRGKSALFPGVHQNTTSEKRKLNDEGFWIWLTRFSDVKIKMFQRVRCTFKLLHGVGCK